MRKYLGIILLSLGFVSPVWASNSCITINSILDYGTYGLVNWTLDDKTCQSGNTIGFGFGTTTSMDLTTNSSSRFSSLNLSETGNGTYPNTAWSETATCNVAHNDNSEYTNTTVYQTRISKLASAIDADQLWSDLIPDYTSLYLQVYSSGAGCNFQVPNNEEKKNDTEAYEISIPLTFTYPSSSTTTIAAQVFAGYYLGEIGTYQLLHLVVTDPDGYQTENTYLLNATTTDMVYFQYGGIYYKNGTYSYYGYLEDFETKATTTATAVKYFGKNIPYGMANDLRYQLNNLPVLTMYDLTGTTTASSTTFGLDYRECTAMDFFTGEDFIDCQYNALVLFWNTFFVPSDTSLDFLNSSFQELQNVFPFNIFLGFNNVFRTQIEAVFVNQDTDLNLTVGSFGIGNLHYLASTTISDLVGSDIKTTWDTLISSVVYLAVALKIFMTLI